VSDMAIILGLILLALTWLALRGMGSDDKPRRHARRRSPDDHHGHRDHGHGHGHGPDHAESRS